jgi:hypothetical protein
VTELVRTPKSIPPHRTAMREKAPQRLIPVRGHECMKIAAAIATQLFHCWAGIGCAVIPVSEN